MKINKETQEKIQELQLIEQNLQSLLMQKQAFQMELNETDNALSEVEKTKEDVFKIIGQIMLKTDKSEVEKELKEKKDIISLRLKSLEKQENSLKQRLEKLREEVTSEINKLN
jgi:prefoldin beta subunit